jgi:hypothetical protein
MQALKRLNERIGQMIEDDQKKIGGLTVSAMARLGLAELRQAMSMEGTIAQPTPYGIWGAQMTPGEVSAARQEPDVGVASPDLAPVELSTEPSVEPLEAARQRTAARAMEAPAKERDGLGKE